MRTLEFVVKKQRLLKKRGCDFSGLVAGTVGYLHAKFHISDPSWDLCTIKIARFWLGDIEYAVPLDGNNVCLIPEEVLIGENIELSVLGASSGYRLETNRAKIKQEVK